MTQESERGMGIMLNKTLAAPLVALALVTVGLAGCATYDTAGARPAGQDPAVTEETVDDTTQDDAVGDVVPLAVVESAVGATEDQDWYWYAVVVDNPNPDHIFPDATFTIEAIAADGTILASDSHWKVLLSGQTALVGWFTDIGDEQIAHLDVIGPEPSEAVHSPAGETGYVSFDDLEVVEDEWYVTVSGTVTSEFSDDQEYVEVAVIGRDATGAIVAAEYGYVDRVPAGGSARFSVDVWDAPAGLEYEVFASY
ncbi:FxLYD domain-containing protein [Microbacterium sp. SSW1-59]|uniref:FxLYD domain-containing protein n=1 Tax=Microbacterium xanthum TaxID=3079794 RepID=UPI002AD40D44|nr:FxLYD domain-containing protein [Microbacterium sp. SSW1-59]MDZ8201207.1 FxLYD domain-containing protein [Microbacterium sp. SSW1-59]